MDPVYWSRSAFVDCSNKHNISNTKSNVPHIHKHFCAVKLIANATEFRRSTVSPGWTLNNNWPLFVFPDGGSLCRESPAGGTACLDVPYAWDRSHDSRLPGRGRHYRQGKTGSSSADFNRSATNWWVSMVHFFIYLRIYWVSLIYLLIYLFIYEFIGWVWFIN